MSSITFQERVPAGDVWEAAGLDEKNLREDERLLMRDWTAPAGKRIAVSVRVEPKVYFANERTFLEWLSFAVLIGSIATTLSNFMDADNLRGSTGAALFTLAALLAIVCSPLPTQHHLRVTSLSSTGPGGRAVL
ncbi:uncharacterized protein EDB91DRAFT_1335642 [Suillus paluster]|uniref:uncharacterized protein n=1 Tax=Suillus paluster TaxID=48578 RepID=UPI001B868364|nr:uncharacterized protein EDB91DRAFT_1335642 [Suillus paluster]KAG1743955.1 hypothetical protein EDB91DRAFT_1335642 [Suillus paluster]